MNRQQRRQATGSAKESSTSYTPAQNTNNPYGRYIFLLDEDVPAKAFARSILGTALDDAPQGQLYDDSIYTQIAKRWDIYRRDFRKFYEALNFKPSGKTSKEIGESVFNLIVQKFEWSYTKTAVGDKFHLVVNLTPEEYAAKSFLLETINCTPHVFDHFNGVRSLDHCSGVLYKTLLEYAVYAVKTPIQDRYPVGRTPIARFSFSRQTNPRRFSVDAIYIEMAEDGEFQLTAR